MNKKKPIIFQLITVFTLVTMSFSPLAVTAQEKGIFLQQRFDKTEEIITKKTSLKKLNSLKYRLEKQGVTFSYSNLKYNKNKEITAIELKIRNNKSSATITFNHSKNTIPVIKIQDINGFFSFKTNKSHPFKRKNYK